MQILAIGRTLDNPLYFTYDCRNPNCENRDGINLPDSEFPQMLEVAEYGLDPELCLQCQNIELIGAHK